MKGRSKIIALGLIGFSVSMISLMPASVAIQMAGLDKSITIIKPSGTIWNGRAQTLIAKRQQFNNIEWQVHPLSFLGGALNVDVTSRDESYPLQANVSVAMSGDIEAEGIRGILPASIISQFGAGSLVSIEGSLSVKLKHLTITNNTISSADGEIFLNQGLLVSPVKSTLGDIKLTLSEQKGNVLIKIKDQGAPIGIEGVLTLRPGNKMSFNAYLNPRESADRFLVGMLKNVAIPQSDGRLKIQYDGNY